MSALGLCSGGVTLNGCAELYSCAEVEFVCAAQVVGWSWSRPLRALLPSTYSMETEQARQTHNTHWWILHPFCRFVAIWQLVVIASVAITTFLIPFQYGLRNPYSFLGEWTNDTHPLHPFMDGKHPGTKEYKASAKIVQQITDQVAIGNEFIFILHMLLTVITGYYKSSNKEVVLAPSRIIKRYLTTWFFPDLVSIIDFTDVHKSIVAQAYVRTRHIAGSEQSYLLKVWIVPYFFKAIRLHYVFTYTSTWCQMGSLQPITRRGNNHVSIF